MKKLYYTLLFTLSVLLWSRTTVSAQGCQPIVPVMNVDLTGQPNGTWTSPAIQRNGYCCTASGADNCVDFNITLDPASQGIAFNIVSGAIPPGALYYQINCGPPVAVGSVICLNGPGPWMLTFCKPGGNTNTYSITSIPAPAANGTPWVSNACTGMMAITGVTTSSVTWSSIPYNATYNSYLSCTSGCDTVTVTPTGSVPAYVDYQVCGSVIGGCSNASFCDTIRIHFVNTLAVNITPQNPVICYGQGYATVTANPSGGNPAYTYSWSTGATTQSINVGPGTYTVQMTDSMNCMTATDIVTVGAYTLPIAANAGADQLLCSAPTAQLSGTIQAAGGGLWYGGSGMYSPNDTTMNAVYTPSASEIAAGYAHLYLVTTNNSGCAADTDDVTITISQNPTPVISGSNLICGSQATVYTTPFVSGNTYAWSVTGGTIVTSNANSVTVQWPASGSGTVTVTESNPAGCDSTVTYNITVAPQPAPVMNGAATVCTGTTTTYTVTNPTPSDAFVWNVTGGTIVGSSTGTSITVQWSTPGSAMVYVHESNSAGCNGMATIGVNVLQTPTPVISGTTPVCAGQTTTYTTPFVAGNNYAWSVTGGSVVSSSSNSVTIIWPTAGNGTVTVTENNTATCDSTVTMNVLVAPQPAPVITGTNTVCTGTTTTYGLTTSTPGNTYAWSVTGGTIVGSSSGTSVNIQWNAPGTATISLHESNSSGCNATATYTVNILQTPSPVITGTTPVCAGQTFTYTTPYVAGNTYSWNVTGGNTVSTNNNSITVYWPTAGTGSLTIIENNTSTCSANDNLNVVVAPQPAPVITGAATVCTNTSTTYSVGTTTPGDIYYWNVTGGMITGSSNSASVNIQWTLPGTATITLYESNSYGCDSTVTLTVNVLQTPSPSIMGSTPVCAGQTATYTTTYVTGNTYNWNVTGGNIINTSGGTVTITWPAAGTGSITVTENNTSTCATTANTYVTVAPQPAPVITGNPTVCTGSSTAYTVTNPVSGDAYAWTVSGGAIIGSSNTSSINVQWSNAGTATISVHESNSYGCDSTISFTVNVLQMPAPSISGSNHICAGATITYTTPLTTGNTYNWTVNGGTVISTSANTVTVLWANAGSGSVTVNESNTSACYASVTYNVNVGAQPAPVINGSTGICWNANGTYSVATPVTGDYYSWSVSGGNIIGSSNGSSINVQWTTSGAGTVMLTESNAFGCDSTIITNVTVNPQPTPHLAGTPRTCVQLTQEYSVDDVQGDTYTWSVSNGSIVGFALGHSIQVYWGNAGQGYVACRQMNPTGCDSTVAMGVQIDPLPVIAITGPHAICENEGTGYSITPAAGSTYTWSVTGGTASTNPNAPYVGVNWAAAGGTVTLTETDINGCTNQNSINVAVNPKPHPAIAGSAVGCVSNALNQYTTLSQPGYAYNWATVGGTIVSGNGTNHISVHWTTAGANTITLHVTNTSTGCDSTVAIPITVDSLPVPNILANSFAGCAPIDVSFMSNLSNPNYHYTWSFGDGNTSTSATPSHSYTNPGSYPIHLIVTNNTGCADTTTASVNAWPSPSANFSLSYNDDFYYANQTQLALTNSSAGAIAYLWDFGNGDTSTSFQPYYQYMAAGNYTITLTVVNQHGCRDVTNYPIEVRLPENIFVPNAFTPNDDGSNDYFSIQALNITDFNVKIFNRWGGVIFQSDDPAFKWDGRMNGHYVQEGVYVWQIKAKGYKGKDFDLIGSVTVAK